MKVSRLCTRYALTISIYAVLTNMKHNLISRLHGRSSLLPHYPYIKLILGMLQCCHEIGCILVLVNCIKTCGNDYKHYAFYTNMLFFLESSVPSDGYMCYSIHSPLILILYCRMFNTGPLAERIQSYCQPVLETKLSEISRKPLAFSLRNITLKLPCLKQQ